MKKLFVPLIFIFFAYASCEVKEIPVQNISITIMEDFLIIGEQASVYTTFFPSDTTETKLLYSSSNENILSINNSGIITPKSKGTATITVKCQNGIEVSKTVIVCQIVKKPTIINASEEWGPYEKIKGDGDGGYSKEIGINNGVQVLINPNTVVEDARLIVAGELITNDGCEKENTKFSQVLIEAEGWFAFDNITISQLSVKYGKGSISNCVFLDTHYSNVFGTLYAYTYSGPAGAGASLELSRNIFNGKFNFSATSGLTMRNNLLKSKFEFRYNPFSPDSCIFQYNTIDINTATIQYNAQTPNVDLANNYWCTTDTSLIDAFIVDRNDSLSIDYFVNYQPILTQRHELTPSLE